MKITLTAASDYDPSMDDGRALRRRPVSVCALCAAAFLVVGLATLGSSWNGHLSTSAGLLLAAIGLGFVAARFHAGRIAETTSNLTLWGVLAGVAGTASGSLAATGTFSASRFALGSLIAAALIGSVWWCAVLSSSRH